MWFILVNPPNFAAVIKRAFLMIWDAAAKNDQLAKSHSSLRWIRDTDQT